MIVTIAGSVETVEPTDDELGGLSIGLAAFDGEVGNGTFPFNDAANALTAVTGRQLMVEEGSTVLSDGFMLDQDRTRTTEPQGRLYGFGLMDANALLDGFRVTRSRPAETDVARVLAFAALDGPAWDTSMVLVAETVTMPKKRYDSDGGWTSELIPDLVSYTGKTLFLHDLADGSGRCLHYHNLISGHLCGLIITDDPSLVDHVTYWEPWEPQRQRTSVDLRNDINAHDQQGRTSTATDSTSITAHDADGLQHQSLTDFEAASQTDLDVQTAAALASQKNDLDTWTCQIGPLDETALALIRVGDIISVTSAVMGLSFEEQRLSHLTLTPAIGSNGTAVPDKWMATLEMGAPIRRRRRRPAKALVDRTTHPPTGEGIPWASCGPGNITGAWDAIDSVSFPYTLIPGTVFGTSATLTAAAGDLGRGGFTGLTRSTGFGQQTGRLYVDPIVGATATAIFGIGDVGLQIVQDNSGTPTLTAEWNVAAIELYTSTVVLSGWFNYKFLSLPNSDCYSAPYTVAKFWPVGDSEPDWVNCMALDLIGDTDVTLVANTNNLDAEWTATAEWPSWCELPDPCLPGIVDMDDPPASGYHWTVLGPVLPVETPDGATSTFTIPATTYGSSYIPGTLVISVEGIAQTTAQTDPENGTGTIGWEPTSDNLVTVSWLVP